MHFEYGSVGGASACSQPVDHVGEAEHILAHPCKAEEGMVEGV